MKNDKIYVSITVISLLVAFSLIAWMYKDKISTDLLNKVSNSQDKLIRTNSASLGPANAKVTIVEFIDPECESCRAFYPYVKNIMAEHKDDIRLVIRYAPFHQNSLFAAKMLEAIRLQGKYWQALELFLELQPEWGSHHAPKPELLWTYLPLIQVDVEKVKTDMESTSIKNLIEQDIQDGKDLVVTKTPTFYVNGELLTKFGYNELRSLVLSKLK